MAATSIGSTGNYPYPLAKMPAMSDAADIQVALRNYHYGQNGALTAGTDPTAGIAFYLKEIQEDIADLVTADATVVSKTIIDAKGDLIVGSAADTVVRLAVGSPGYILSTNTGPASGLEWIAPPQSATTSVVGIVQLSDSTSETSSVKAATPTAVKAVQDSKSALNFTIDAKTADYSLVLSDAYKIIEMNLTSTANTLTIPLASVHEFPQGSQITIIQTGSGQTTILGTAGVTINGTPGLKLRDQYSSCTLIKRSAANLNTWIVIGDLSA